MIKPKYTNLWFLHREQEVYVVSDSSPKTDKQIVRCGKCNSIVYLMEPCEDFDCLIRHNNEKHRLDDNPSSW